MHLCRRSQLCAAKKCGRMCRMRLQRKGTVAELVAPDEADLMPARTRRPAAGGDQAYFYRTQIRHTVRGRAPEA